MQSNPDMPKQNLQAKSLETKAKTFEENRRRRKAYDTIIYATELAIST